MMDRFVIGLLAASAVFGALLLVELNSAAEPPVALPSIAQREASSAAVPKQTPQVDQLVQTALAQPLFSPTRHPPNADAGDRNTGPELPNMRLTGIVIEPEHHLAIFAVPGGKPLSRGEGETVNEWRVESIAPNQVALIGASGTTVLEPKSDPNLARPKPVVSPPQPAVANAPAAPPRAAAQKPAAPAPAPAASPPAHPAVAPGRPAQRSNQTRSQ